jgi:very-short-patch-repair endonuclease
VAAEGGRVGPGRARTLPEGRPNSAVPLGVARALRKRMTPQEAKLWVALRTLRPAGFHFRRQVPIGPYVVDFACLKHRLIVEVDGGQHGLSDRAEAVVIATLSSLSRGFACGVIGILTSTETSGR